MKTIEFAVVVAINRTRSRGCGQGIVLCAMQEEVLLIVRPSGSRKHGVGRGNFAADIPYRPPRVLADQDRRAGTVQNIREPTLIKVDLQCSRAPLRRQVYQAGSCE